MSSRIYQKRAPDLRRTPQTARQSPRPSHDPEVGETAAVDLPTQLARAARYGHSISKIAVGSGGSPGGHLPKPLRKTMESAFQQDFSDVRVRIAAEPEQHGANALARGSELLFAPGAFQPATNAGRRLIAHELAHVVQQRAGRVPRPQKAGDIIEHPRLEAEAYSAGDRAAAGIRPALSMSSAIAATGREFVK